MTIEGGRDAPHPTFSYAEFGLLFGRVFVQAVRRIGNHRVKAFVRLVLDPVEAVRVKKSRLVKLHGFTPFLESDQSPLHLANGSSLYRVDAAFLSDK